MTSTTLTTAPVTKSVQHVPKKVRIRVPINNRVGVRDFFFARRSFRCPKQGAFRGPILWSDRSNLCVYNRYRFRLWVSFSNCWSRRRFFRVDRPKNAEAAAAAFARERERESNSTYYTAFYNSRAITKKDKTREEEAPRGWWCDRETLLWHPGFFGLFFFFEKKKTTNTVSKCTVF